MPKSARYTNNAFFDNSKVVIITGASSGIGKAVALALADYNTKLVIVARRRNKLYQTASSLKKKKIEVLTVVGDVRDRDTRTKIIDMTLKIFGRIDVLINNAGLGKTNLFIEQPEEEIEQLVETNVISLIKMTQQVIPIMKVQAEGLIINLSSTLALLPVYPFAVYCATKSAVKTFSDCIRQELRNYGITVCTVLPGPYKTEFNTVAGLDEEKLLSYEVKVLASKIARLVLKPKNNLVQPWIFIPLLWLTRLFSSMKDKISIKIADQINNSRISNQKKIESNVNLAEKEIEVLIQE